MRGEAWWPGGATQKISEDVFGSRFKVNCAYREKQSRHLNCCTLSSLSFMSNYRTATWLQAASHRIGPSDFVNQRRFAKK